MKRIDMTGWNMWEHGVSESRWRVLEYKQNSKWLCECSCENKTRRIINGNDLRSGHSKSCGCLKSEKTSLRKSKNITNKKFGFLTALYPTEKRQQTNIVWHCLCDCGNECDISIMYLENGHTQSCGCLNQSIGSITIAKLLKENNIPFEQEKTFSDCKDKNLLPFDFYVNNSYLIEYDGLQHFKQGGKGSSWHNLEYYQKHDDIKNQWCIQHNIPLIRIPYTLKEITLSDLLINDNNKYLFREERNYYEN